MIHRKYQFAELFYFIPKLLQPLFHPPVAKQYSLLSLAHQYDVGLSSFQDSVHGCKLLAGEAALTWAD